MSTCPQGIVWRWSRKIMLHHGILWTKARPDGLGLFNCRQRPLAEVQLGAISPANAGE